MSRKLPLPLCLLLALPLASPLLAHHSFTMFDMTKRITLNGR